MVFFRGIGWATMESVARAKKPKVRQFADSSEVFLATAGLASASRGDFAPPK
jgi:hypothetical protein